MLENIKVSLNERLFQIKVNQPRKYVLETALNRIVKYLVVHHYTQRLKFRCLHR